MLLLVSVSVCVLIVSAVYMSICDQYSKKCFCMLIELCTHIYHNYIYTVILFCSTRAHIMIIYFSIHAATRVHSRNEQYSSHVTDVPEWGGEKGFLLLCVSYSEGIMYSFCLQDAFWAMVVLIGAQRYAMHGMLIPGLPKLLAYCDLHGRIRRRYLPKLDRHFVSIDLVRSKFWYMYRFIS